MGLNIFGNQGLILERSVLRKSNGLFDTVLIFIIMMRLLFFLLCFPLILVGQPDTIVNPTTPVFKIVEEMPQFLDCGPIKVLSRSACFQNYVCTNLIRGPFAEKNGVKGKVIVYFEINETGKVENAKIIQNIGASCDTATLNFVNAMPDWIPGRQRGKTVKVAYKLAVDYQPSSLDCQ